MSESTTIVTAIDVFEEQFGRKPTEDEVRLLEQSASLTLDSLKMTGCLINYPSPVSE